MKRLIAIAGMLTAAYCSSFADTETVDGIKWTYTVSDGTVCIGGEFGVPPPPAISTSTAGDLVIPSSLGNYPVTSIGDYAFRSCSSLASITIPDSVTSIGYGAFQGCSSLASITIPDSVTSIGACAFQNCSSLASITIPDSVTSIGADAFEGCAKLWATWVRMAIVSMTGGGWSPYSLTDRTADRTIASITVDGNYAIGEFVLKDGKVYDSMLYVSNIADHEVSLSLPSGYSYKTFKGSKPLTIPAKSQCLISITRVSDTTFIVVREELDDIQ